MGILRTKVVLMAPGGEQEETLDLIVDTGSTLTWIDARILRRMPALRKARAFLALTAS